MTAEESIRRTQTLYVQSVDDHDVETLVNLFADDAVLSARAGTYTGKDEIRRWIVDYYAGQPQSRIEKHIFANPLITVDGNTAEARTDLIVFRCLSDAPWRAEVITRHHDQLRQVDGRWLFQQKRIERIAIF